MSVILRMVYVCKSDPSVRFYDEESLRTFVSTNSTDRRYTFWDTVYEVFDTEAPADIQTNLSLAFTPKDTIQSFSQPESKNGNSTTSITSTYVRYSGTAEGSEQIPNATGTGKTITYKNQSNFNWTLTTPGSNTLDGLSSFILKKQNSITIVDSGVNTWDII